MADKVINAKGLKCPMPIVCVATAIKEITENQTIEIQADDPAFEKDIQAFCRMSGNTLETFKSEKGMHTAVIKKGKYS